MSNIDRMPRQVRLIQVIHTRVMEGEGRDAHDPIREVDYYYSPEGELLARRDEYEERP